MAHPRMLKPELRQYALAIYAKHCKLKNTMPSKQGTSKIRKAKVVELRSIITDLVKENGILVAGGASPTKPTTTRTYSEIGQDNAKLRRALKGAQEDKINLKRALDKANERIAKGKTFQAQVSDKLDRYVKADTITQGLIKKSNGLLNDSRATCIRMNDKLTHYVDQNIELGKKLAHEQTRWGALKEVAKRDLHSLQCERRTVAELKEIRNTLVDELDRSEEACNLMLTTAQQLKADKARLVQYIGHLVCNPKRSED